MQEPQVTKGCVLVVDDDESMRDMIELMLKLEGFEVITAEDGAAAVAQYQENWCRIDVAILDLMVPQMSGLDACRAMKAINPGDGHLIICFPEPK